MIQNITLTGIDERTDLDVCLCMATQGVEFGILLSENPGERHRYPSSAWIAAAVNKLGRHCAVHVCGRTARERFLSNDYHGWIDLAGRIQINGEVARAELEWALSHYPDQQIITQHTEANDDLRWPEVPHCVWGKHALLVDASGGRGLQPPEWLAPETIKPVGFAGGLGPVNLPVELHRIASVADIGSWVDMETSLRAEGDWFSIELAGLAIRAVRAFNVENPGAQERT